MDCTRALVVLAGVLTGSLALTGCGSSSPETSAGDRATSSASSTTTAGATTTSSPRATRSAGATSTASASGGASAGAGAARSVVSGKVVRAQDRTASVSGPGGDVAIRWTSATVIIDSVNAKAGDVKIGSCVLVIPPDQGPSPTAKAVVAGTVRLIDSSPSCPPIPGVQPGADGTAASGEGDGGSLTVVGGRGVIGSVSAVSGKGFTLRSRAHGTTRTIAVTTSRTTRYRKAGDHPRAAVDVGRCATVWGRTGAGGRVTASRIRVSDPVGGVCPAAVS